MYFYYQVGVNSWALLTLSKDNAFRVESIGILESEALAKEYVEYKTALTKAN